MNAIYVKLIEGGPFFMFPILFLLILILVLIVKGFIDKNRNNSKIISLISSVGLFTLVWGILGQTFGLIQAFDAIQEARDISLEILSGGLKVSLLTTVFGLFTFLVARLGIIILIVIQKEKTP